MLRWWRTSDMLLRVLGPLLLLHVLNLLLLLHLLSLLRLLREVWQELLLRGGARGHHTEGERLSLRPPCADLLL